MAGSRRTHFVTSVVSASLVLYVFALLYLVIYVSNNFSKHLRENILLQVVLDKTNTPERNKAIGQRLTEAPFTLRTEYIDSTTAAREFIAETGQDFIADLGYNPLYNSYDLYLKGEFSEDNQLQEVAGELKKIPGVAEVRYQQNMAEKINHFFNSVTPVLAGLSLLFFVIAVLLINNTVRLNIYSQRFLIKSMQYVGATRGFIMRPFLMKAVLNGLISGIIASLLIFNTSYVLLYFMPYLDVVLPHFYRSINILLLIEIMFALSLAGVILSGVSTYFATRKYLKTKIEELY